MTSRVAPLETAAALPSNSDWRPHAMKGMAFGGLIMGFFGCLWLLWGLAALSFPGPAAVAAAAVFAASIWIPGIAVLRTASRLTMSSGHLTDTQKGEQSRMGRLFGLIFAAEGVLIFLAVNVLNYLHLGTYAVAAVGAIVGLHFLPLARLYRRPMYTVVGVIMTLTALLSCALPASIRVGALATAMSATLWTTCALILWRAFVMGREIQTR